MPDETAPVVSGATETPALEAAAPSSTSTQTSSESTPSTEAPSESATPKEKADWKARLRDDPELRAFVDAENQRANAKARKKWERENARATAKDIATKEDVEAALEFTRSYADAPDDDDEDGTPAGESPAAKHAALFTAKGIQHTPEYKALYEADQEALTKAYQSKSAAEFERWVKTEGFNTSVSKAVQAELKKQLPDLSEARALEMTNEALKHVPIPLGGGGAATGGMTYDMLQAMPVAQRNTFKRDNPAQYDALVQRAAGG